MRYTIAKKILALFVVLNFAPMIRLPQFIL